MKTRYWRYCVKADGLFPGVTMILAALVVQPLPLLASQAGLSKSDLEIGDTLALARHLLPANMAAQVASHELQDKPPILAGDTPVHKAIRFFLRPSTAAKGICRRDTYYVSLEQPSPDNGLYRSQGPAAASRTQLAISGDCAKAPDSAFGWLRSARDEEGAVAALQKLVSIQDQTRRHDRLPLQVECRSLISRSDPCEAGMLEVVRNLRIDRIFAIESDSNSAGTPPIWRFSVMPMGPGQAYFDTRLIPNGDGWRMQLTWDAPAPF